MIDLTRRDAAINMVQIVVHLNGDGSWEGGVYGEASPDVGSDVEVDCSKLR
jgi:hypothetical protein